MTIDGLWLTQTEALQVCIGYYDKYHKKKSGILSAVVKMPTGTGKTGIIAAFTRVFLHGKSSLVVTPRVALRDQAYMNINHDYGECKDNKIKNDEFKKSFLFQRKHVLPEGKNQVVNITQSSVINEHLGKKNGTVFVITYQMLFMLYESRLENSLYVDIVKEVKAIILDEGHYEPAEEWSKSIRNCNKPSIIFTATPYRNDFKYFNIDHGYFYNLTFTRASQENYIRQVHISNSKENTGPINPKELVRILVREYVNRFGEIKESENSPKVIIKCSTQDEIRDVCQELYDNHLPYVGIHDTFRKSTEESYRKWFVKGVPSTSNKTYAQKIFWIHQYKLLEGIDNHQFRMLAIYGKIELIRQTTQQIGRIVRLSTQGVPEVAYVLDFWEGHHLRHWQRYLEYDGDKNSVLHQFESTAELNLYKMYLKEMGSRSYLIKGKAYEGFTHFIDSPMEDIALEKRVTIHEKKVINNRNSSGLEQFSKKMVEELSKNGYYVHTVWQIEESLLPENVYGVHAILYSRVSKSPYILHYAHIDAVIKPFVVVETPRCIYISNPLLVNSELISKELGVRSIIDRKLVVNALGTSTGTTNVRKINLINSDLGSKAIRYRTITAYSIEETLPMFDDYSQICTHAEGYAKSNSGASDQLRYVGISTGHISQLGKTVYPLKEYVSWIGFIDQLIFSEKIQSKIWQRYAIEKSKPAQAEPRNILLDFNEVNLKYRSRSSNDYFEIVDLCYDIDEKGNFTILETNSEKEYTVHIQFDHKRDTYHLSSDDLASDFRREGLTTSNIISDLNASQAFRVLPLDYSVFYYQRSFYSPKIRFGNDFNMDSFVLADCMIPLYSLDVMTEKGSKENLFNPSIDWDSSSLFGVIINTILGKEESNAELKSHIGDPDIAICDDLGNEIADFIIADTIKNRVVFIHVKGATSAADTSGTEIPSSRTLCAPGVSAQGMQQLCAQAEQKIGYASLYNSEIPPNLSLWSNPYGKKDLSLDESIRKRRIIRGEGTPEMIWENIQKIIQKPNSSREIWLLTSGILSYEKYLASISHANPSPSSIQLTYLLYGTMSVVSSINAKFHIFCNE
jgi:superfamily II DNA or RNA helicase